MLNSFQYGVALNDNNILSEYNTKSMKNSDSDNNIVDIDVSKNKNKLEISSSFELKNNIKQIKELIVFRLPLGELKKSLKSNKLKMLVNSENINNGTSGLTSLYEHKRKISEPKALSHWFSIIGDPKRNLFFFFGFKIPIMHRTFIRIKEGYLECGCLIQESLKPQIRYKGDIFLVLKGTSAIELIKQFSKICFTNTNNNNIKNIDIGWNSWDYFLTTVKEEDINKTISEIKKNKNNIDFNIKYIVIDDGWYECKGNWLGNAKFNKDIQSIADKIKKEGFVPGIWASPFYIEKESEVFKKNPNICTKDKEGNYVKEHIYNILDVTNKDAQILLYKWFKYLYDVGFRYFKIDFIHNLITSNPRFSEDSMPRLQIIRKGLKIIKDAIGDDSYLIACGCLPEAAIDIADACRIGGDISTFFTTTKVQAQFLSTRFWMNNILFKSDPDFLVVRGNKTSVEEDNNPFIKTLGEIYWDSSGSRSKQPWKDDKEPRIWATLVGMSGGLITLSDNIGKLNQKGFDLINTTVKYSDDESAIPLDIMESLHPSIWYRSGSKKSLALINWDDEEKTIKLSLDKYPFLSSFISTTDVWNGKKLILENNLLKIKLDAHDVSWFVL